MAINSAADLEKALQIPRPESNFQVGESELKEMRRLAKYFDPEIQFPNRDALPALPIPSNKIEL